MMPTIADHVTSASAALPGEQLLRAPLRVLLGASEAAAAALGDLHIRTVFDLAASSLFATAAALTALEGDPALAESRLDTVAADAVTIPPGVPANELGRHSIGVLKGIDQAGTAALSAALDVQTVRDLALWPPFRAARNILMATFFPEAASDADAGTSGDLLPTSGVYPVERVFYRKLLIDVAPPAASGVAALEGAGAIDLGAALATPVAFERTATGALLTFRQSWFSQGLTLGQLLHSMSLAPGESTRVAMIDWTRRSRAEASESISESEQLSNVAAHTRALSEVTNATATEVQHGTSRVDTSSTTGQAGIGSGLDLGPLQIGSAGGVSGTTTDTMSASSSFGARDLAADLAQQVNDHSQQHASAARNRRASVVREVSQQEHETISTRVVTNYNHMHALTVQYYEVVQAFRVTTELARAERCLFVPLQLVSFRDAATVDRLRPVLARAALTGEALRQLTTEYGTVEVVPQTPRVSPGRLAIDNLAAFNAVVGGTIGSGTAGGAASDNASGGSTTGGNVSGGVVGGGLAGGGTVIRRDAPIVASAGDAAALAAVPYERGPANTATTILAAKGWNVDQISRLATLSGLVPARAGSDSVFVADEAALLSVSLGTGQTGRIVIRKRDNSEVAAAESSPNSVVLAAAIPIADLRSISVQNAGASEVRTALVLHVSIGGTVVPLDVPILLRPGGVNTALQDAVKFSAMRAAPALVEHLEANRLHYSRAVFRTLDAAAIATLLGRFTYRGVALSHVVEPQPFAVTANFLVFRMNVPLDAEFSDGPFAAEQAAWRDFLARRGLERPVPKTEVIPLPSGGVFAEAVLGRFNSAEKIDLKRFWNWQDSPIPDTAPEIAAIRAASRAQAEGLLPGQFGAPVVSIQAPAALPVAAGVAPMLAAIQNSAFRDMSGVAQTAALAQAAAQGSGAAATAVGGQAARNLFNMMDQHTQRMKIASDLIGSLYGAGAATGDSGGGKPAAGRGTPTARGLQLAAAERVDQMKSAGAAAPSPVGPAAAGTGAAAAGAAGGAADAAPAAPATLTKDLLRTQSGTNINEAAEQMVDAAVAGATGGAVTVERAVTPSPPATPSVRLRPRNYRLVIYSKATKGVGITGTPSSSYISAEEGDQTFFMVTLTDKDSSIVSFTTALPVILVDATALIGPKQFRARALMPLYLLHPNARKMQLPTGEEVTFVGPITVTPILRTKTFTVPMIAEPAALEVRPLDPAKLDEQISASGLPEEALVGEPTLELKLPGHWRVTLTFIDPLLLIKQAAPRENA